MVLQRRRHFLPFLWTLSSSNHKTESTGNISEHFQTRGSREHAGRRETLGLLRAGLAARQNLRSTCRGGAVDSSFFFSYARTEDGFQEPSQAGFIWHMRKCRSKRALVKQARGELMPPPNPSCILSRCPCLNCYTCSTVNRFSRQRDIQG